MYGEKKRDFFFAGIIIYYILIYIVDREIRTNKTILINLHDLNLATKYCDKIIFLKDGTVFDQGIQNQVITSENIQSVYGIAANVIEDPSSRHPIVQPISKIL